MQFDKFDIRCDVLRAAFCNSRDVFVERLHYFLAGERLHDFFVERVRDFVCGEVA